MIEFINYDKFFIEDRFIKIGDLEINVRCKDHLDEFRLIKKFIGLDKESVNNSDIIDIINLGVQCDKEKLASILWDRVKDTTVFNIIYEEIQKNIIVRYFDLMNDANTQEYLKIGDVKITVEKESPELIEKDFYDFFLELVNIKIYNISLYGATIYTHYIRRAEAKANISRISEIQSCLFDILELYSGGDKIRKNFVRSTIDDYRRVLGRNKPTYKVMKFSDLAVEE